MGRRVPATLAQHGVWFTERVGVARSGYHLPLPIRLDGPVDERALVAACRAVAARHPALGGAFEERGGVPYLVRAATAVPVERQDLSGAAAGEDETLLAAGIRRETMRPFDLSRGPLLRLTLFVLSPTSVVLLAVAHHLVFDGESKDVFVADLAACYGALVGGATPDLSPLPDWQAGQVTRERDGLAAARAYWRERWQEPPDAVLPGLGRVETAAAAGERLDVPVDDELHRDLAAAAGALGVTPFELLLAAFQALLRRYGNREVVVAVDMATRTPGTRACVGLLVNELPVASRPSLTATFRELARATREGLRERYPHRDVPLAQAVTGIRPRASLAPVSMSYRRRAGMPAFPGLTATVDWTAFNGTARGALHLQAVDAPEALGLSLQYSPEALSGESAALIAGHYRALLRGIAAGPDALVGDLPLLTAPERDGLVSGWTTTPGATTVPELFEAQAARTPDSPAVVHGDRTLTYAQLDAAVKRLTHRLRREGAGPGTLVAVCAERSPELIAGLLAVLRTGAAYLPLDPGYPARRLALVLEDAAAPLLLAQERLLDRLPAHQARVVLLKEDDPPHPDPPPPGGREEEDAAAAGDDLAYVIYTSGSTGRPKGVEVEHRSLVSLLRAMEAQVGGGGVWLGLTSPSFDISAQEMFLPLVTGGRVVVAGDGRHGDRLLREIGEHGVTHVQATPSGWKVLLAAGFDQPAVTALAGGEALPLPLARELRARCARLVNAYGPTETTVWSTAWAVPATAVEAVCIGRPLANTQACVLDERLEPLPAGLAGELCLGGAGVARGYRGRPAETAERFVPNPHGPAGSRLYRTGDLVRRRLDGELEFLGRADDQVKVRGHRVELGEVEAGLLEHAGVAEAAVALRADAADEPCLVAYVVLRPGARPVEADLRQHLAGVLPEYMVPAAFVTLERLPLTPNGKLDRRALPEPPRQQAANGEAAVGAGIARDVHAIWREVLRMDEIGPDDNLFELGGHSLTATLIVSRIRKRLKVDVPLHVFYDTPTISGIVRAIAGSRG